MIKTGMFHGLFGFAKGKVLIIFQSKDVVCVEFEEVQFRNVDNIRGHVTLRLDVTFEPGTQEWATFVRNYTYFSRPFDARTKGEVPFKTKQAIINAIIERINQMRGTDEFKKNLVSAERLRLQDEVNKANRVVAECEEALGDAMDVAKAAEQARFDWLMKHYPNDPEVVRA